jgi:methionyl aminopeptidase
VRIEYKSAREIALMRRAGLLVWESHQLVRTMIAPGATTKQLDAAVELFFQKHNAVPLFKGVKGKVPFPAVTCISINEEVVHGIPGPRKLKEGDIVSVDTGCRLNGWCGDSAWTYGVGNLHPEVRRLLEVAEGMLQLSIELMGKAEWWSQVAGEMAEYVNRRGFAVVENFVGHGIGREMHEDPQVPNFVSDQMRKGQDFRLLPGLVIAIEPMVNMGSKRVKTRSDHWTQVTADGRPSAHFEHTVALTSAGPYVLTAGPEEDQRMARLGYEAIAAPLGSATPPRR